MDVEDIGIDASVDKAMEILNKDAPADKDSGAEPEQNNLQEIEGEAGAETPPDEPKPSEQEKPEAEKPIEPPASWRSDEKANFETLDRNSQEAIKRVDQAQQSHFTQRSTELAQKIRATDDERQQYQTERASYRTELERLGQMAAQLLPAKFQDIKSESDYIRLKATDPSRAAEFEAFQMTLNMANQQQSAVRETEMKDHLNREWQSLIEKFPDFKDEKKGPAMIDAVRKTAVEYYGFTPNEVKVITDHRYVPIIQDAMAWRSHQANLKAVQAKKSVPVPTKVLKQTSTNGTTTLGEDRRKAILNRASKATNDREKAEILSQLLSS